MRERETERDRDTERGSVSECVHVICVLHKLIILSKFVIEKEKKKKTRGKNTQKTPLHLHYSKIIVFVVLLSFCVILTRVRMTQ